MSSAHPVHHASLAALLAFTAGYVDTVGFVAVFGLFTAHVTGNFVVLGASLASPHAGLVAKLLALPAFIVAVAGTYTLVRTMKRNGGRNLLLLQAVLMFAFMMIGVAAEPLTDADAPLSIAAGLAGVVAMSVQNVSARTTFSKLSPTTVMTGNVTQVTIDFVETLLGSGEQEETARDRLHKMAWPVLSFALGAGLGGGLYAALGFWCVGLGIVITLVAALLASDEPLRQ